MKAPTHTPTRLDSGPDAFDSLAVVRHQAGLFPGLLELLRSCLELLPETDQGKALSAKISAVLDQAAAGPT